MRVLNNGIQIRMRNVDKFLLLQNVRTISHTFKQQGFEERHVTSDFVSNVLRKCDNKLMLCQIEMYDILCSASRLRQTMIEQYRYIGSLVTEEMIGSFLNEFYLDDTISRDQKSQLKVMAKEFDKKITESILSDIPETEDAKYWAVAKKNDIEFLLQDGIQYEFVCRDDINDFDLYTKFTYSCTTPNLYL